MELSLLQIIVLSIIQAVTEFLPISSSAHLLLPSKVLGWPDQGIIFDITVHLATLLAVLVYFRNKFLKIDFYFSKIFIYLILSTMPIMIIVLLVDEIGDYRWSIASIAVANIVFALLLYISERLNTNKFENKDMSAKHALFIGFFQAFSLISGASRS